MTSNQIYTHTAGMLWFGDVDHVIQVTDRYHSLSTDLEIMSKALSDVFTPANTACMKRNTQSIIHTHMHCIRQILSPLPSDMRRCYLPGWLLARSTPRRHS